MIVSIHGHMAISLHFVSFTIDILIVKLRQNQELRLKAIATKVIVLGDISVCMCVCVIG